jgi:hypothetical protein
MAALRAGFATLKTSRFTCRKAAQSTGGGAKVRPERGLTIGSRRHEVEPPARAEDAGAEAGHHVSALVFEGHRWHRGEHVVRQKGHESVEICRLPRADELCYERLLGG